MHKRRVTLQTETVRQTVPRIPTLRGADAICAIRGGCEVRAVRAVRAVQGVVDLGMEQFRPALRMQPDSCAVPGSWTFAARMNWEARAKEPAETMFLGQHLAEQEVREPGKFESPAERAEFDTLKGDGKVSAKRLTGNRKKGFSLIEVTLALAIVGFAFIVLIGLLPAGLNIFNAAMAETVQMRISTDLTSLLQATDYEKLRSSDFGTKIYYFDNDGGLLPEGDSYKNQRAFAARMVVDDQNIPTQAGDFDAAKTAQKVLVAMGRSNDDVVTKLQALNSAQDVAQLGVNSRIKVQPIMVAKLDGLY